MEQNQKEYRKSTKWLISMTVLGLSLMIPAWSMSGTNYVIIYYPFWIIGAVIIFRVVSTYIGTRINLTNTGVRVTRGLLFKKTVDIPYFRISSFEVSRVIGNTGSISIATSDSTEKMVSDGVGDIKDLQTELNSRTRAQSGNYVSEQQTPKPRDDKSQFSNIELLEKLSVLKAKGVLTEEEYSLEKQKIING